ncbi:hypothetical protein FBZ93_116185 [Bradyrhizobium macuxiense]|uniref:Uncharacterized protein n=2 Tax=Bradyrhizobium macuxiense TaxID=1755647 RepID=A0A560L1Q3_9BRAD|nr:hypothetical protein FBZ93_116185 [Bradyrhizobium macuxiense]
MARDLRRQAIWYRSSQVVNEFANELEDITTALNEVVITSGKEAVSAGAHPAKPEVMRCRSQMVKERGESAASQILFEGSRRSSLA